MNHVFIRIGTYIIVLLTILLGLAPLAHAQQGNALDDYATIGLQGDAAIEVLLNDFFGDSSAMISSVGEAVNGTATDNQNGVIFYLADQQALATQGVAFQDSFMYFSQTSGPVQEMDSAMVYISFLPDTCSVDCVWPGDADFNGITNAWDILPIGVGYGVTGFQREIMGSDWIGTSAANWNLFYGNTNYKHLDCNGDGIIDAADVEAIDLNYGNTTGKTETSTDAAAFSIYLDIQNETIGEGDLVVANIRLGDVEAPAENIYGLAFSIIYDEVLIDSSSATIEVFDSWFASQSQVISVYKDLSGTVEFGVSRTNHIPVSGNGDIGTLSFVMEDVLSGKTDDVELVLSFGEVTVINELGVPQDVIGVGDSRTITTTDITEIDRVEQNVQIFPNPSTGLVKIETDDAMEIHSIQLIDINGRVVHEEQLDAISTQHSLNLEHLNTGLYFLHMIGSEQLSIVQNISIIK